MADEHFIIDVNTRQITVPTTFLNAGVIYDQNALKIYFEIGRTYKGEDLSTHDIAIQYVNAKGEKDVYVVTEKDLTVSDKIIFAWEISNHVTKYAGDVSFAVMFSSTEDNKYTYRYNTTIATFKVLDGITVSLSDIVTPYDILNKIITTEADPTVPAWAKEPNKPTYTAEEVGALPDTADTNFVHKSGDETISGNKTFTENVIAPNLVGGNTAYGGTIVDNLNNITKNGFYTCYGTAIGAPNTSFSWFVIHQNSNAGTTSATQRCTAYGDNSIVCERKKVDGVWKDFVLQVSRSEFDGAITDLDSQLAQIPTQLNARIDNIITPNGDPTLAELVDLRLQEDGTLSASASEAMREQVSKLSNKIGYIRKAGSRNKLDISTAKYGTSIDATGAEVPSATGTTETTGFLDMTAGDYVFSQDGLAATLLVVGFYNSSKTYISRVTNVSTFTAPIGTAYYRATYNGIFPSKSQIESGIKRTSYEPYYITQNIQIDGENMVERSISVNGLKENEFNVFSEILTPHTKSNGYYADTGTYSESTAFSCKVYKVTRKKQTFYYTGTMLGSAKVAMATFFDDNMIKVGDNGIYSNSTKTKQYRYDVKTPDNVTYIAFCSYIATNDLFYVETKNIQYKNNDISMGNFVGHINYPSLNTDFSHIICYGQSLSNGSDSKYVKDDAIDGNCVLGTIDSPSTELNALVLNSGQQHPIISTINSLSTLMREHISKSTKYIAGSYGAGGQSIAQLMSTSRQTEIKSEDGYTYDISTSGRYNIFLNALTYGKTMTDTKEETISCPAIIFLQGERDYYSDEELTTQSGSTVNAYACGGNKEKYKLYMKRLKEDMQNAVMSTYGQATPPLFFIYQVSGAFVKNKEMSINMAQIEFAEENDDVILLQSPYFLPNYNSAHLSTNGYRWYGEYIAKAMLQTLIQKSEYRPLLLSGCIVDGNNIRVKACNASLPLTIDIYTVEEATNYGFALFVDGSEVSISSVSVYGDEIIISSSVNLSSATSIELSYAGMERNGTGNIRDNSPYVALYSYWDDSSDTGTSGTLTISYRPTDKAGNSIIGKKYPMQNWLQSFYKKIR